MIGSNHKVVQCNAVRRTVVESPAKRSNLSNIMKPMSGVALGVAILVLASPVPVAGQDNGASDGPVEGVQVSFRPSVAIVVAIFVIMFFLTFLLLLYAKFCHVAGGGLFSPDADLLPPRLRQSLSGVDKAVIESLPFFRFSALKGSRDGLECAVCLSKFDDTDLLRFLPKCKHAFHMDCVDRWLEAHSSCPLCRCKVDADDVAAFMDSCSYRFLVPSTRMDDGDLELFVEREPGEPGSSSRFSVGSSFRKMEKILKDKKEEPLIQEQGDEEVQPLHKFKHRIIVSDVMFKSRWSDVNSSDLMLLNSEMLNMISSKRFSALELNSDYQTEAVSLETRSAADERIAKLKEEMEKKRLLESKASQINRSHVVSIPSSETVVDSSVASRSLISPGKRSMSEITNLSRFGDVLGRSRVVRDQANSSKDEQLRRIWLPIARRTVQWFAGRESRSQTQYHTKQTQIV